MKTGYSGIMFDFNGTLFFDSDKQEESWEIISMRLRGRAFGKQEMQRRMHGRSGKSIFEYLLERDVPDDDVLRLMRSVGFGDLEILPDPAGIPRVVLGDLYQEI